MPINIPAQLVFVPFKCIDVPCVHICPFVGRTLRIVFFAEVVCPVGVNGVVRSVLVVNLFPNIYFAAGGPSAGIVLGHHPEGWKVAGVACGFDAGFNASVLKTIEVAAGYVPADHGYVVALFVGVFDATGVVVSVANEGDAVVVGYESCPRCSCASLVSPFGWVGAGVGSFGTVELISPHVAPALHGAALAIGQRGEERRYNDLSIVGEERSGNVVAVDVEFS